MLDLAEFEAAISGDPPEMPRRRGVCEPELPHRIAAQRQAELEAVRELTTGELEASLRLAAGHQFDLQAALNAARLQQAHLAIQRLHGSISLSDFTRRQASITRRVSQLRYLTTVKVHFFLFIAA